jgi:hypothetical protein
MRTFLLAVGILIVASSLARADDSVEIVKKAVQVTAQSDLILNSRLQNMIRAEKGAFYPPDGEKPAQRTVYLAPDRIKFEAVMTGGGKKQPILLSASGVRGWKLMDGSVQDLTVIEYDAIKNEADTWGLITLRSLRQKDVKLKSLPGATINDKPAVVVNISRPNRPDAQMYFAADTGLPVKVAVKVREVGIEVAREYALAVYHEFDGIKLPTKVTVTQNGRKIEDWTVTDYKCPEKMDEKLFERPR